MKKLNSNCVNDGNMTAMRMMTIVYENPISLETFERESILNKLILH